MKEITTGVLHDARNAEKILNMTSDTMILVHHEGICVDAVIKSSQIYLQEINIIGKNVFLLLPPVTYEKIKPEFDKVVKTGQISTKNYELPCEDETYYFKCIMYPYDEEHVLCQYRDITDRSRTKIELEKTNWELKEIEKVAQIGHWTYLSKNNTFILEGFLPDENLDKKSTIITLGNFQKLIHKEDRHVFLQWVTKNIVRPEKESVEFRIIIENQVSHYRLKIIDSEMDEEGYAVLEGYVQNITDIVKRKSDLEIITKAVNNAREDIFAVKKDGTITFANNLFRTHHHIPEDMDVADIKIYELPSANIIAENWSKLFNFFLKNSNNASYIADKIFPGHKKELSYDYSSYIIKDSQDEDLIWTFGRDISERIRYENRIKELNQIMDTVLENIPVSIVVKDTGNGFRYIYRNNITYEELKINTKETLGKTDFDVYHLEKAKKYRNEDIEILKTGKPINHIMEEQNTRGEIVIINKLKILVDNGEQAPLIISLGWNVTEIKLLERELIAAKEKAEQSDKLKSAFLANMSHEIRTPLNAIVGFSRIIAETDDMDERKNYYDVVSANNDRLLQLINEILDLSKIESGILEFTLKPLNLNSLCREIFDTHSFRCQEPVKLIFEEPNCDIIINSDKNRIFQVFSNLIGNAIKFTKKGTIRYGYELKGNVVRCFVTDTGIGIPKDKIDSVFERFMKVDNYAQGTGLGLSICKSIVEKLGGTIMVSSEISVSTTFTFTLPYTPVEIQAEKLNVKLEKKVLTENKKITILVAEDTQSNYDLINAMIGKLYTLVHARDGIEAVRMYEQFVPDLVLMDIKMPNMSGLDATAMIRELSPEIPIIALSAFAYDEDKEKAFKAGCNEFLTKPISLQALKDSLNKYI